MNDTDDHIDTDRVDIDARRVIVNTGWTIEMAKWNTIGTLGGFFVGVASLVLSAIAIVIVLTQR